VKAIAHVKYRFQNPGTSECCLSLESRAFQPRVQQLLMAKECHLPQMGVNRQDTEVAWGYGLLLLLVYYRAD